MTSEVLFEDGKHRVGIENLNADKVQKYVWRGENPGRYDIDVESISDDMLMYFPKFKIERMEAVYGIPVYKFGLYLSEIQSWDNWYYSLRTNKCFKGEINFE